VAVEIKIPSVGESITEGILARWLKKDGEVVRADEPVLELETDKATGEIAAPAAGTLRITVPEGQTVPIGSVVGRIEENKAGAASGPSREKPPAKEAPAKAKPQPEAEIAASPAARKLAEEGGVKLQDVKGSGRGGRITKEDVAALVERPAQSAEKAPPPPAPAKEEKPPQPQPEHAKDMHPAATAAPSRQTRQRMSTIRQRIAERLVSSQQTTATLTTFNEADLSAILDLRNKYKERFREKHGVNLGFMGFFVKACVEALRAYPVVNARIDGADIINQNFHDIGVAVSTDKGLMVPVLRDVDQLSFAQIEKLIAELAQRARDGKITVADLQGGTFTITNGGVFGSLLSTPILNPPESAILGMHTIQKRPVAVNDQVVVRPMMYLALSYDHRLIDGRDAVLFLIRVKECVEDPERLLLEV
jgi:2-oxoglutarate dehydrogenase E2 component (dihydrolipoamide succinyltransferase)